MHGLRTIVSTHGPADTRGTLLFLVATFSVLAACQDAQSLTESTVSPAFETSTESGLILRTVNAGNRHTCGIAFGGRAFCWGRNSTGMVGDGTFTDSNVPVEVAGGFRFISISAGYNHTCGVADGGQAYCWGSGRFGQLGVGVDTLGLSFDRLIDAPLAVASAAAFASVSAGALHSCGITRNGDALCWGANASGQLGDGSNTWSYVPVDVAGGFEFAEISAAEFGVHTCGVTTDGQGLCWGRNDFGQLGDGSTTSSTVPVEVEGDYEFASISAGAEYTCGVTTDGLLLCWGDNTNGRLGDGTGVSSTEPVLVGNGYLSVSAGSAHSCAVTIHRGIHCWSRNNRGQLGDGTTNDSWVPVRVTGGYAFASVSAGSGAHSCGITRVGGAFCWGRNQYGQLGDGSNTDSLVPTAVDMPL